MKPLTCCRLWSDALLTRFDKWKSRGDAIANVHGSIVTVIRCSADALVLSLSHYAMGGKLKMIKRRLLASLLVTAMLLTLFSPPKIVLAAGGETPDVSPLTVNAGADGNTATLRRYAGRTEGVEFEHRNL